MTEKEIERIEQTVQIIERYELLMLRLMGLPTVEKLVVATKLMRRGLELMKECFEETFNESSEA